MYYSFVVSFEVTSEKTKIYDAIRAEVGMVIKTKKRLKLTINNRGDTRIEHALKSR